MPKQPNTEFTTEYNAYNERIKFGNKYIVNKEPKDTRKGSQLVNWGEQLVSLLAFNYKDKKEEKVFRHQERSYDRMKLSLRHEKAFSANSIRTVSQTSFIDQKIDTSRKLSKNGSVDTLSGDDSDLSDTISELSASGSYTSADSSSISSSSCDLGSLNVLDIGDKCETTRVIARFGNGFEDKCLFPLALTLNVTDHTKGRLTWDSINSKADLVLNKWCSRYSRKVNRVLSSASDFVYPEPSLQNNILLNAKNINKALKRWNSYEDLHSLNRPTLSQSNSLSPLVSTDDSYYTRKQFKRLPKHNIEKDWKKSESNHISDASNELIILEPISSPLFTKRPIIVQNARHDAKSLLKNIKANSPLSLALYITELDKQYFMQLKDTQLLHCMVGGCGLNQKKDLTELKDMLAFGLELNRFVVAVIRRQITPETQAIKIGGFIEVACLLRRLRNWHSLVNIIRALQSPKIYFMEEAWMVLKKAFPVHFNDYIKMCRLVRLNETCIIGSTFGPSIPSLASLVFKISIHCIATWDLLSVRRKWTEQPSLAVWVESELEAYQKLRQRHEESYMLSLECSRHSLLPVNDPVRAYPYSSLPSNWIKKDIKYITHSYLKSIVKCFQNSFNEEINSIRQYSIPSAQNLHIGTGIQ